MTKTTFCGITFKTNVWNAPIPLTWEQTKELNDSDLTGAFVFKTRTLHETIGNPTGWVLNDNSSENSIALHNAGWELLKKDISKLPPKKPIILSVFGTQEELETMIEDLYYANTKFGRKFLLEVNLSCPNINHTPLDTYTLIKKAKQSPNSFPIGFKIGYDQKVDQEFDRDLNCKPDFITCINTIGGVGGNVIRDIALKKIRSVRKKFPKIPIIGVGGCETSADVQMFIDNGATAVEIGTGYLRWGIQVFDQSPEALLDKFVTTGKKFTLRNGEESFIYANFRTAPQFPLIWKQLVDRIVYAVKDLEFDVVVGVPYGAIPLATAVAMKMNKPLVTCRKTAKTYGTANIVEHATEDTGTTCLLLEDVVTTGQSVRETCTILKQHGYTVLHTFCLFNRSTNNAINNVMTTSVTFTSLFTLEDIRNMHVYRLKQIMNTKNTRLCFSADCSDGNELLEMVEKVAPYICMLKLHTDIMTNVPDDFAERLYALTEQHDFLILEDRKLLDIPSIAQRQLDNLLSMYFFHFVTVHAAAGPEIMNVIPPYVGVFLVTNMSSNKDLDLEFIESDIIVGVVSQKQIHDSHHLLRLVPGVHKKQTTDSLGQNYRSPEEVNGDIIVVGRGIYEAEDPEKAAREYKNEKQN